MTTTPGISAGKTRPAPLLLEDVEQVLAVDARGHRLGQPLEIAGRDVAHTERDFLETGDHQPLPLLDGLDVVGGLHQRLVRASVEPGNTSRQLLDVELTALEIRAVDVCDFELAARGGLELRSNVDDLVVVEVQPS